MDFQDLLNSSGPFNAHSLLQDARELQKLCKSGQELSGKMNRMMHECQRMQSDYDGILKQAVDLAGKFTQHATSAQQQSSLSRAGAPSLEPFIFENLALDPSEDPRQQDFGFSSSGLFNVEFNRSIGIHPSGSGATAKVETGDQRSKDGEPEHLQATGSGLVRNEAIRKRPSTAASSNGAKKLKANQNGINLEEFREHVANLSKLRDESTGYLKCPVCDGVVKHQQVRHLQEHLDKAYHPYKCSEEGCDITATRIDTVQRHVISIHKLLWTDELKAACTDAEKERSMKARQ